MALKYTLSVNSQKRQQWLVEIDVPSHDGDPIVLEGDQNPILIEWDGGTNDNPFDNHIISQSATFRVWSDGLDIEELQLISDGSVKCRVYLDGQLKHQGYLVSDGIQEPDSGVSSLITIKSIDGLSLLDNNPFVWSDNYGRITVDGTLSEQRCPMNAIRLALYASRNLGNILPIRWSTSLRSEQYPNSDMLAGLNTIIEDGKLTLYSNYSTYWYLENILKTANCWLYQRDGYWWIENREDTIRNNGFFIGHEITINYLGPQVASNISIDLNTTALANEFILQDQYWMTKKPLGGVNVIYNDTTNNNNVMPNGGFDLWTTGVLIDWGFKAIEGDIPSYSDFESLEAREGQSVQLTNEGNATEEAVFSFFETIPLDSHILYNKFLFGFTFLPTQFGFPYDSTETIVWDSNPLKISVSFTYNDQTWYLNEFGYWQSTGRGLALGVLFVNMERVTSGSSQTGYIYIYKAVFEGSPNIGDVLAISIRSSSGSGSYNEYSFTVTPTEEGNLELALYALLATIPNSIDGWNIGNKQIEMDSPTRGKVRFSHTIFLGDSTARTYKSGATQEYQFIFPTVDSMKINDIATIAFQGKGGNSEISLPDIGQPYDNTNGRLDIEFYVKPGQRYVLDNVYFNVPENHDKYELRVSGSKATIDNYEVGISSSFSGFKWSNYMNDYSQSNLALLWRRFNDTQGKTLTQLYGELILDWRRLPRKVFDGSIDRIVQAGDFLTIKGKKYVVMNASVQGDGITKVLAFEAVLDAGYYSVTHKGTIENDDN